MEMKFKRATKQAAKLRLAICGPSGSGKTYTSLSVARHLGGKIALIDSERGSASKYADLFDFDVLELDGDFNPQTYIQAIQAAENEGYDIIIIDSLSHAWTGTGGALDMVDKASIKTKNSFTAWREVTPLHNKFVDSMVNSKSHVIATMRTKTEYILEEKNGKQVPRKVGMAPIQRDGIEYEFDITADMDYDNNFIVTKTRCPKLNGAVIKQPDGNLSEILLDWLKGNKQDHTKQTNNFPTKKAETLPDPVSHNLSKQSHDNQIPPTTEVKSNKTMAKSSTSGSAFDFSVIPCQLKVDEEVIERLTSWRDIPTNKLMKLKTIFEKGSLPVKVLPDARIQFMAEIEKAIDARAEDREAKEVKTFENICADAELVDLEKIVRDKRMNAKNKSIALRYFMQALINLKTCDGISASTWFDLLNSIPAEIERNDIMFKEAINSILNKKEK